MHFAFGDLSYIQNELIEAGIKLTDCCKLAQVCNPLAFLHLSRPKTLDVF